MYAYSRSDAVYNCRCHYHNTWCAISEGEGDGEVLGHSSSRDPLQQHTHHCMLILNHCHSGRLEVHRCRSCCNGDNI